MNLILLECCASLVPFEHRKNALLLGVQPSLSVKTELWRVLYSDFLPSALKTPAAWNPAFFRARLISPDVHLMFINSCIVSCRLAIVDLYRTMRQHTTQLVWTREWQNVCESYVWGERSVWRHNNNINNFWQFTWTRGVERFKMAVPMYIVKHIIQTHRKFTIAFGSLLLCSLVFFRWDVWSAGSGVHVRDKTNSMDRCKIKSRLWQARVYRMHRMA